MGKNKVFLKTEKPYFQFVNLIENVMHLIFPLLPYSLPRNYLINSKMVTAILGISKFTNNSFIYSCLIFKNIKQIYSKKSLKTSGPKASCLLHKLLKIVCKIYPHNPSLSQKIFIFVLSKNFGC